MDDRVKEARRTALVQAAGILGTNADMSEMGIDAGVALRNAAEVIKGLRPAPPGTPPEVVRAVEEARAWVRGIIEDALIGAGRGSGLDPLTWAERQVQQEILSL